MDFRLERAHAMLGIGQIQEASSIFEAALRDAAFRDAASKDANGLRMALVLLGQGRVDKAQGRFDPALRRFREALENLSSIHDGDGVALYRESARRWIAELSR